MKKLISFVILVYKSEKYISKTLQSIFEQTSDNYEIVIVNNGSPDNSMRIVSQLMSEHPEISHKIVEIEENKGVGKGRTRGYREAKGSYIAYVDSDDCIVPDFVKTIENHVDRSPDIVTFGYMTIDDTGRKILEVLPPTDEKFVRFNLSMFWAYCFKNELAVQQRIDTTGMTLCEDRVFSIKLSEVIRKVKIIKKPLYIYRENQTSTTQLLLSKKNEYFDARTVVFNEYVKLYKLLTNKHEKKYVNYVAYRYYYEIICNIMKENIKEKRMKIQVEQYRKMFEEKYKMKVDTSRKFFIIPKIKSPKVMYLNQSFYIFEKIGLLNFIMKCFVLYLKRNV